MLLNFKIENYKSFAEEKEFSMMAAPKQKGLDHSLFKLAYKGKEQKILSSAVIYGPNASGKTNLIGAMETLKTIVTTGNIRNTDNHVSPNVSAYMMEYIPNIDFQEPKPVKFSISFIKNEYHIKYSLCADLGTFLDKEYDRKIIFEELKVDGKVLFKRNDSITLGGLTDLNKFTGKALGKGVNELLEIANESLCKDELFLTNGFKSIFAPVLAKLIIDWFVNEFMIIYQSNLMQLVRRYTNTKKTDNRIAYVDNDINRVARMFGVSSNVIAYMKDNEDSEPKMYSLLKNQNKVVLSNEFESYGTIRFLNIFSLISLAIDKGLTLIIDEFDASIHPMAIMNLINVFHNDDINKNHAQLIFNTHNPIYLNKNLFRRDEINFVDRDETSPYSDLYRLSDFKTSGNEAVRKGDDYMKNYFINRYGAIKQVDFSSIFEKQNGDNHD